MFSMAHIEGKVESVQMSYRVDAGSAGFIRRLFCPVMALVEAWQSLGAEQHYRG